MTKRTRREYNVTTTKSGRKSGRQQRSGIGGTRPTTKRAGVRVVRSPSVIEKSESNAWLALTNGTLSLEGRATDHTVIAQFLDELEARSQFANNELKEVHQPKEQPEPGNKRFSVQSRIVNHTTELNRNESTP